MNDDDKNPMPAPGAEAASGGSADEAAQRSASDELYPRDCGTLSLPVRILLVTLRKGPYLYRDKRKEMWALLLANLDAVRVQLANLLLDLVVDDEVGVAYVRRPEVEGGAPSLLNQYTFKFLDSVLLVEMRDRLMRAGQAGERAVLSMDEIRTHLAVFEPSAKTDTALFETRVMSVLKRMRERHLLFDLGSSAESFEVSPVLKTVFDAAQIDSLRRSYAEYVEQAKRASSLVEDSDTPEETD